MERSLNLNEVSDWIKFQMERGLILKEVWYWKKFDMKSSLKWIKVWDGEKFEMGWVLVDTKPSCKLINLYLYL